ncbi:MAG TPA: hypothetical protein VGS19_11680 [Streptosporangiaceae bacterium]|nr:hypothetical protein [Streptosporangiaceae bacterium]
MRTTYDPAADAVYIHLTGVPLPPGRTTAARPHHCPGQQPARHRAEHEMRRGLHLCSASLPAGPPPL